MNICYIKLHKLLYVLTLIIPFLSVLQKASNKLAKEKTNIRILRNVCPKRLRDVEITPFKYGMDGSLCISIDVELAWGERFSVGPSLATLIAKLSRKNIPHLIQVFERYLTPVTWSIVGHLFIDRCERDPISGLPHPGMPRPKFHRNKHWAYAKGDWYQHDPCGTVNTAPWWYAPDLISRILRSRVKKEVGTHSFSHIDFSNNNCSVDLALAELMKCKDTMSAIGLTPRSIVFPGNLVGDLDVLPKVGITTYRGHDDQYKVQYPSRSKNGLWDIRQSMQLVGKGREDRLVQIAKRLIDCAIASNAVFHLWFHPYEVDENTTQRALVPILEYANEMRKKGKLWIATMEEIANYCEAREKTILDVVYYPDETKIDLGAEGIDYQRFTHPEVSLKIKETSRKTTVNGRPIDAYEHYSKNGFLIATVRLHKEKVSNGDH